LYWTRILKSDMRCGFKRCVDGMGVQE
jgi:hypothetical protein